MTTRHLGEEGFRWFIGTVEDRNDPLKLGRVRIRVINLHSDKQSRIRTEELPWANILNNPTSASYNKVGVSPTGITVGATVVGFFMDGKDGNHPVVMGTLAGIPGNDNKNHDVPSEARELNTIEKEQVGSEPATAYSSKYPYNKVLRTERGHVIEIDDTPNAERIHLYHRSGTYVEINQDGRMVTKVADDDYEIVVKNKEVYIKGNVNMQVEGSYTLNATGPVAINGSTVNINNGSKGAARIGDAVPDSETDGTQGIGAGSGTVFIGG